MIVSVAFSSKNAECGCHLDIIREFQPVSGRLSLVSTTYSGALPSSIMRYVCDTSFPLFNK